MQIKNLLIVFSLTFFLVGQSNCYAFFIYSAKSQSLRAQENLQNSLLPAFRYDRNNIELSQRISIDLLLDKSAQFVEVEVVGAEGTGLGIDNTNLLKNGLKIFSAKQLRSKKELFQKRKKILFDLKKLENQSLIIQAIDFKVFKIFVRGILPGSYTLKATVDKNETATTTVFTKSDFRVDSINPSIIDPGIETTITLIGKGFDSLDNVIISTADIEVREILSLDDSTLKVKLFAKDMASPGGRNVTVTSPLFGKSATVVNGLFVNVQQLGIDGLGVDSIGSTGPTGPSGKDGDPGKDGKSFCTNPDDSLKVLSNNLPPGSMNTVFFDPVLCTLTFGIPVGFNGVNGSNGITGTDGMGLCNNISLTPSTVIMTLSPGSMATVDLDPAACTITYGIPQGDTGATGATGSTGATGAAGMDGTNGTNGTNGLNCWDTNGNGVNDSSEDINMDGSYSTLDCQGPEIRTADDLVTNWSSLSDEQNFTTVSGSITRMVKIPYFVNDGIIYGGFWVDKYEASRADATATSQGTSSTPVSQRNVVPWTGINQATAKSNATASGRQITGVGTCRLIGMREWTALWLLGRYSKENGLNGATATNGWNERGNTRSGKDGRNNASFTCADDPTESGGALGRCLTGTGFKSWGHVLDGSATKNTDGTTFSMSGTADSVSNSDSAFDDDKQVYDLDGNAREWVDFSVTRTGGTAKVDSGYQAAGLTIPLDTTGNFNYLDLSLGSQTNADTDFQGLGFPTSTGSLTDTNGGNNGGRFIRSATNASYGTIRGGTWTDSTNATSPINLDISNAPTTSDTSTGFRVICDFSSP